MRGAGLRKLPRSTSTLQPFRTLNLSTIQPFNFSTFLVSAARAAAMATAATRRRTGALLVVLPEPGYAGVAERRLLEALYQRAVSASVLKAAAVQIDRQMLIGVAAPFDIERPVAAARGGVDGY